LYNVDTTIFCNNFSNGVVTHNMSLIFFNHITKLQIPLDELLGDRAKRENIKLDQTENHLIVEAASSG
jgi:hypothetical protein